MQPFLTLISILNRSVKSPFTMTQAKLSTYILLISPDSLPLTSYILNPCHKASQLTLSYAFSKSIIPIYTDLHTPFLLKSPLVHHQSNPQSLYELFLLGSLYIFFQPRLKGLYLYNSYINFSLLYPCKMEQSQHPSNLQAQHHSQRPYYTASISNPTPYHLHLLLFLQ